MNPEEKTPPHAEPAEPAKRPDTDAGADAALELAEINVIKPLRVTDEDVGGDPYNRTGRFSVDD